MTVEQAYDIAGKAVAVHIARQALRNADRNRFSKQSEFDTALTDYNRTVFDLDNAIRSLPEDAFTRVK